MKRLFAAFFLLVSLLVGSLPARDAALQSPAQAPAKAPPAKSSRPATKSAAPAKAPAPVDPALLDLQVPWVHRVLPNGLEVIILPDRTVPLVTVELAVRIGSFREPPQLSGISHFYEHLFFKENRAIVNREAYLEGIGEKGITYNGTTREEVASFYFTSLAQDYDTSLHYLRDAARYPVFNPQEVEREREVVIDEINRNDANPYSALLRESERLLFGALASRKNPAGRMATVRAIRIEDLRAWQRSFVVPNNAAIILTGDVDVEDAMRRVSAYFGDWPRSELPADLGAPPEFAPLGKSAATVVEGAVQNAIVGIRWQGPSIGKDTAATYAADVLSLILRQSGSRFTRALVDSGLTTGAGFNYYTQRYTGPITLTLQTSPEKLRPALRAAYAEIARFQDPAYYTDEELENAKTALAADDLYSRERPTDYAHTLSFWWSSTGADYFRGYQAELRRTTREDIRRYVADYILGKPCVIVALLPRGAQQQLALKPEELIQP